MLASTTTREKQQRSTAAFDRAFEENQLGVDFFRSRQYDSAILSFWWSLANLQTFSTTATNELTSLTSSLFGESSTNDVWSPWAVIRSLGTGIATSALAKNTIPHDEYAEDALPVEGNDTGCHYAPPSHSRALLNWHSLPTAVVHSNNNANINIDSNATATTSAPSSGLGYVWIEFERHSIVPVVDTTAIFRNPIVLKEEHRAGLEDPPNKNISMIRASLLFNLGLAHQMKAASLATSVCDNPYLDWTLQEEPWLFLRKAILLYDLSMNVQQLEGVLIGQTNAMALCNNIGQCYRSIDRTSESDAWNR